MSMHQLRRKVIIQKPVFMRNYSGFSDIFLSTIQKFWEEILMQKLGERILSNWQLRMTVYIRIVITKNLVANSMMFLHWNIHTYTWTSPDGKTYNQIDHILKDRRWHSNIPSVRSFRGADCDTDHYPVFAKVRERLEVSKQAAQSL